MFAAMQSSGVSFRLGGEDGLYIEEQNGETCLEYLWTDIGDKIDTEGWKMKKGTCLGQLRFLSLWSPFIWNASKWDESKGRCWV